MLKMLSFKQKSWGKAEVEVLRKYSLIIFSKKEIRFYPHKRRKSKNYICSFPLLSKRRTWLWNLEFGWNGLKQRSNYHSFIWKKKKKLSIPRPSKITFLWFFWYLKMHLANGCTNTSKMKPRCSQTHSKLWVWGWTLRRWAWLGLEGAGWRHSLGQVLCVHSLCKVPCKANTRQNLCFLPFSVKAKSLSDFFLASINRY